MKTSFSKKFLACVLSVCMILTVCAGALSVSAAAAGTATIAQVEVASDATEAVVPVTLTSDEAIGGAELYITVPAVANITKVDIATAGYDLTFASAETDLTATAGTPVTANVDVTTEGVAKFVLLGNGDFTGVATTVEINLTFAGAFEAGTTYDVDFAAGTMVGTAGNEAAVALTTTKGAIVVAAPHVCEYTYTNNGDNHTKTCAGCGSSVVEDHTYTDGACVCGATEVTEIVPVLDENLQFRDIIVTVTSTVNMRYRVYKNTTDGINGYQALGYDSVKIVVSGKEYSFDTANLYNEVDIPETEITMTGNNNKGNTFLYEGIAMCSLGLEINAYIKAYDANGNYVAYSPVTTTYPEEALRVVLAESTTDEGRASIIELLNMAAAAQKLFGGNKPDSDLGKAVAAGKLVNLNLPTSIVTEVPELNVVDYTVNWEDGTADLQSKLEISPSVSLTVSPNIRLIVKGKNNIDDPSKVSVVFSYLNPEPTVNATQTKPLSAEDGGTLSKRYNFDIPGFEFHNSNQTVTAEVYYDGAVIATVQYSVETYISEQLNDASASVNAKELNAAIAKFGYAFRLAKGIA